MIDKVRNARCAGSADYILADGNFLRMHVWADVIKRVHSAKRSGKRVRIEQITNHDFGLCGDLDCCSAALPAGLDQGTQPVAAAHCQRINHGLAGFAGGSSYENHLRGCLRSWQASYAISCPCVQPPARLWPLVLAALGGFH